MSQLLTDHMLPAAAVPDSSKVLEEEEENSFHQEFELTSAATDLLASVKKLIVHIDQTSLLSNNETYISLRESLLSAVLSLGSNNYQVYNSMPAS